MKTFKLISYKTNYEVMIKNTCSVFISLLILLKFQFSFSQTTEEKVLSNRVANYEITAKLSPETKIIDGKLKLRWKNTSADTLKDLRFHLYMNGFKNSNSTFMNESMLEIQESILYKNRNDWGWINVLSMKTKSGDDLMKNSRFIQPDDNNKEDQTVLQIFLKDSLFPGKWIELEIEFQTKLPKIVARTGFADDYFMIGQWFPKIGVYESAAQRHARKGQWNCHQFHANSEFFADFGTYQVDITIPSRFQVGATGVLVKEQQVNDSIKTLSYKADDVIDFAWSASPKFQIIEDRWENVKIRLLIQPEHKKHTQRYISSLKSALEYLSKNVGAYPYPAITVIDPPINGIQSGGMEYPMLITGISFSFIPKSLKLTELVTVHEFGHQYFMGILASNEFEEAWLDEGINSYFESKIMNAVYGENTSVLSLWGFFIGNIEYHRLQYNYSNNPKIAESFRNSWEYKQGGYGTCSYDKPVVFLTTLERMIGNETMTEIIKTYYERWKFKHPKTNDFINIVNEIVTKKHDKKFGNDMNWFFAQVLYRSEVCDYKLSLIENHYQVPQKGYYNKDGKMEYVNNSSEMIYKSRVVVNRLGELTFPVEILIHFENGEELLETWDGKARSTDFVYQTTKKISWAKVDPENKILMDINLKNNSYTIKPDHNPIWKYTLKFLFWIQNILHSAGFVA